MQNESESSGAMPDKDQQADVSGIEPWGAGQANGIPGIAERVGIAHDELKNAIASLAALTSADTPPSRAVLAAARWRLVAANRKRIAAVASAIDAVRPCATAADAARLERIGRMSDDLVHFTHDYVQKWTPEQVALDWLGYRRASARKQALLADSIAAEREVLGSLMRLNGSA